MNLEPLPMRSTVKPELPESPLACNQNSRSPCASAGSVEELKRIVAQIRSEWYEVRTVVRGDSGFCREELMAWCEAEGVDYLLGLAKNERLKAEIEKEMAEAKAQYQQTRRAARLFKEFVYQTRKSWGRARRVVAKAEHQEKGENPRFVVTKLEEPSGAVGCDTEGRSGRFPRSLPGGDLASGGERNATERSIEQTDSYWLA